MSHNNNNNNDDEGWILVRHNRNKKKKTTDNHISNNNNIPNNNNITNTKVNNYGSINNNNWSSTDNPIIFNKNTKIVETVAKTNTSSNKKDDGNYQHLNKVEQKIEEGTYTPEKISKHLQNSIINGRTVLGLNRKDFAKQCNIKENIIKSYEDGTGVPSNTHLLAMSKVLGVSLSKK